MSDPRDWEGEMKRIPIDDATAEMLLSGRLSPDDAPPGYAGVAGMIQAATGPAVAAELAREPVVVAAMRSTPSARPATPRRKPMRTGLLSAKLAALAATAVLAAAGVAVAATGNLPKEAQTTVSDAVAHVGLSIPKPDHAPDALGRETSDVGHGESASPGAADVNADAGPNAHSTFGQCTAFLAGPNSHASGHTPSSSNSGKEHSTAFAALIANHGGTPASATTFCAGVVAAHHDETTVTTEPTETTESTVTTEHGKSSSSGRPSSAGNSGSHTPGSVANGGGTDTANTASGGASSHGTGTADTASGGASSDGSSNADSHSNNGASHRP